MLDDTSHSVPKPRAGSAVLRLVWMSAIPAILLCLLLISDQEPWSVGRYDAVLVALFVAGVVARALDALRFGGTTADGRPATRAHVVGYAIRLLLVTAAVWVVAHSIAL